MHRKIEIFHQFDVNTVNSFRFNVVRVATLPFENENDMIEFVDASLRKRVFDAVVPKVGRLVRILCTLSTFKANELRLFSALLSYLFNYSVCAECSNKRCASVKFSKSS